MRRVGNDEYRWSDGLTGLCLYVVGFLCETCEIREIYGRYGTNTLCSFHTYLFPFITTYTVLRSLTYCTRFSLSALSSSRCLEAATSYDEVLVIGDVCLAFSNTQLSWFRAEQQCKTDGMNLAVVDS